jgi:hypothetical protein
MDVVERPPGDVDLGGERELQREREQRDREQRERDREQRGRDREDMDIIRAAASSRQTQGVKERSRTGGGRQQAGLLVLQHHHQQQQPQRQVQSQFHSQFQVLRTDSWTRLIETSPRVPTPGGGPGRN